MQLVLRAAADPGVRISRVLFGVRRESGDGEGTMAAFLGCDADTSGPHPDPGGLLCEVRLRTGREPTGGRSELLRLLKTVPDLKYVELDACADVPTGTVLGYADVIFRAGASRLSFVGAGLRADEDGIPPAPSQPPAVSVALLGRDIPVLPGCGPLPEVPRAAGFAGNAVVFRGANRRVRPPQDCNDWLSGPK